MREEEDLCSRMQVRLRALRGERQIRGDAGLRLQELRDDATEAREEDLPTLLDQLHVVRSVEDRRRARGPLPEPRSPYFAHFRLREGAKVRDYLLGHIPFLDSETGLRLLDWRNAPLSQLYYRYREGDAYEVELPAGRVEGIVEARRAIVISDGELRAIQTPHGRLERTARGWQRRDEADLPTLEGGAGSSQRGDDPRGLSGLGVGRAGRSRVDVSALLDPTQFEIVHDSGEGPLLVLGSAGSGKTTVAMHRLAALHFQDPETYAQKRLAVVVPEKGLARLVVRLLQPLGLDRVEVGTFSDLALAELATLAPDLPRRVRDDAPSLVMRLKRHRALHDLLPAWLAHPGRSRKIETLRRELLTDRAFLRSVVAKAGDLPLSAVEETVRRTMRQLDQSSERSYRGVDSERLAAIDGRRLDEDTPEDLAQTLDTEDLPLLLELHRLLQPKGGLRARAHMVLDEAQEFSPFERSIVRELVGRSPSLTVAGDDVQRTGAGDFEGWDQLLSDLGVPGALRRTLAVSYRCPAPISQLAHHVLGPLAPPEAPAAGRPGVPIGFHRFPQAGPQILAVQDALTDLVEREPLASIGVLTRSRPAAERWAQTLQHLTEARLVIDGGFSFDPGIDICEVAEAKGLEFDYVVLPDADAASYPDDFDSRRTLHVAITRAMHQLWLTHVGTPTPLVVGAAGLAAAEAGGAPPVRAVVRS